MKKYLLFISLCIISILAIQGQEIGIEVGSIVSNKTHAELASRGITAEISYLQHIGPKLGLGGSVAMSTQPVINLPDIIFSDWSAWLGPSYTVIDSKIKMALSSEIGYIRQHNPEILQFYPNSNVVVTHVKDETVSLFGVRLGAKIGLSLSKRISIYVNPEFRTGFTEPTYQSRNVSDAIDREGNLDVEAANNIDFNTSPLNSSRIGVNVGVNVIFAQDWNSSRSNKTSKTSYIDFEKSNKEIFLALDKKNKKLNSNNG